MIDPLQRWRVYGEMPDFAGPLSFGGVPMTQDSRDLEGADVAIVGAPTDDCVSDRPGTRFAPRAIRAASCPPGPHLEAKGGSEPTGPGANSAGLALYRYRMGCGTVYGHTGNFLGYTQFAAASSDGRRSATVSVNTRLTEQPATRRAFRPLRRAFRRAACAALASPGG